MRSAAYLALIATLVGACERTRTETPEPDAAGGLAGAETGPDNEFTLPYGTRTIHVTADPALDGEVARLFLLFEDFRAEAVPLTDQTRLPIGWTTLSFTDDGERLIVQEPDYDHDPENHTRPDISVSLATLARQRRVLEQVGVPGEAIDFDQHVLIIRGVLEQAEVMLVRVESPGGRMTGWRLTPADGIEEEDEVESIPVYTILAARPELLDAMLLPPGYLVLYSGDQLTTVVDENDHIVWDWTRDGDKPNEGMIDAPDLIPRPKPPKPLLEPLE